MRGHILCMWPFFLRRFCDGHSPNLLLSHYLDEFWRRYRGGYLQIVTTAFVLQISITKSAEFFQHWLHFVAQFCRHIFKSLRLALVGDFF